MSTRGTNFHRAKASMLSRMVGSAPAPPATYTYAPGVRRSLAAAWNSGTVRSFKTSTRSRTMVTAGSARLHPVQKVDEVLPRGTEHVEVEDLLGAGGLDVVRLAGRDKDERSGPDLVWHAVHVIDRAARDDRRDLIEVLLPMRGD